MDYTHENKFARRVVRRAILCLWMLCLSVFFVSKVSVGIPPANALQYNPPTAYLFSPPAWVF